MMKQMFSFILVLMVALSLTVSVSATTLESFAGEMFSGGADELVIPDAQVYFGAAAKNGSTDIKGVISGPYDMYENVDASKVDSYISRMVDLGYDSEQTKLADQNVTLWTFKKADAGIALIISHTTEQIVICYAEGVEFKKEESGQTTGMPVSFNDNFTSPEQEPDAATQTSAGYLTADIDGTERTFVLNSTYHDLLGGEYEFEFIAYNVRNEKELALKISLQSNILAGDIITTEKGKETNCSAEILFFDKNINLYSCILFPDYSVVRVFPYTSNFNLYLDTMSYDGQVFTGRLDAKLIDSSNNGKAVRIKNAQFQFQLYDGDGYHFWLEP